MVSSTTSRTDARHQPPGQRQIDPSGARLAPMDLDHAIGFSGGTSGLWYHPNDTDLVYSCGGSIVACEFDDPHSQRFFRGHDENITTFSVSPDGKFLASGQCGENSDVLVWSYEAEKVLYAFSEHDYGIASLSFSHDSLLLASVGVAHDNKLYIWDLQTGCYVSSAHASSKGQPVNAILFGGMTKDVKGRDTRHYQFATAGTQALVLWSLDPYKGILSSTELSKNRDFTCLAFSQDYRTLYGGANCGGVIAVDIKSKGSKYISVCSGGIRAMTAPRQSNNNICLYIGGGDGTLSSFNLNMEDVERIRLPGPVNNISSSPDGQELLVGTSNGLVHRVDTVQGLKATLLSENPIGAVVAMDFDLESSELFATVSLDCCIRVWNIVDYTVRSKAVISSAGRPTCLSFNLDVMTSGWEDGTVRCHKSENGDALWVISNAHVGGVSSVVMSHNMRFIISGGMNGDVRVWEFRSRELISHLKEHTLAVTSIVLFDDDAHALSSGKDRSILCWDLKNEKRISNHTQRMGGINAVALSNNQTQVLSVGQEKRISYWDLRKPEPVRLINKAHQDEATCIAVAHSVKVFATGGTDAVVKVWDFESAQPVLDLRGHSGTIRSLKFSPDDSRLVSVGDDGGIFIWNVNLKPPAQR